MFMDEGRIEEQKVHDQLFFTEKRGLKNFFPRCLIYAVRQLVLDKKEVATKMKKIKKWFWRIPAVWTVPSSSVAK
jgi:hypothetical protein